MSDTFDAPTVCIAHGSFIPCRKREEHRYTDNPYWVKAVRDYQGSPIEGLTWEPAWERKPRRVVATACTSCGLSIVACHATVATASRRCCPSCSHER